MARTEISGQNMSTLSERQESGHYSRDNICKELEIPDGDIARCCTWLLDKVSLCGCLKDIHMLTWLVIDEAVIIVIDRDRADNRTE